MNSVQNSGAWRGRRRREVGPMAMRLSRRKTTTLTTAPILRKKTGWMLMTLLKKKMLWRSNYYGYKGNESVRKILLSNESLDTVEALRLSN